VGGCKCILGSLRTFTYGGVTFIETGLLHTEKLEVVWKYNRCLNCLQEGHSVESFTGEWVYRLSGCNARHSDDWHTGAGF